MGYHRELTANDDSKGTLSYLKVLTQRIGSNRVNRRAYLASLAVSTAALAGCGALGNSADDSQPEYYGERNVVYEHDSLTLSLQQETVHLGDTIDFEITNTSDSEVGLGCHKPWAIQRHTDEEWEHVTWTSDVYNQLCLTLLRAGGSYTETLKFTKTGLESEADGVGDELTPGRYRFLLLGASPYLATDFEALDYE